MGFDAEVIVAGAGPAAAGAAGARFARFEITQTSEDARGVTLQARDGRRLRARAVIAADGVHSVLAKRLGVNRRWPRSSVALDMVEETPDDTLRARDPEVLWVASAFQGLDGYAYVFPKRRHVNVGIGCLLSHYDAAVTAHPYDLQRGFVEAITAEGIFYAMVSGELAGRAVAESGRSAAGPRYQRLWRREIGAELRDAVFVQRYLFSDHDRVARIVRGAARLPGFIDMILDHVARSRRPAPLPRAS